MTNSPFEREDEWSVSLSVTDATETPNETTYPKSTAGTSAHNAIPNGRKNGRHSSGNGSTKSMKKEKGRSVIRHYRGRHREVIKWEGEPSEKWWNE